MDQSCLNENAMTLFDYKKKENNIKNEERNDEKIFAHEEASTSINSIDLISKIYMFN